MTRNSLTKFKRTVRQSTHNLRIVYIVFSKKRTTMTMKNFISKHFRFILSTHWRYTIYTYAESMVLFVYFGVENHLTMSYIASCKLKRLYWIMQMHSVLVARKFQSKFIHTTRKTHPHITYRKKNLHFTLTSCSMATK